MRVAIIAFGFSGSTLPLVKRLSKLGFLVDCYYLIVSGTSSIEALDLGRRFWLPKMETLSNKELPQLFYYFDSSYVRVNLMVIVKRRHKLEQLGVHIIPKINEFLIKRFCERINSKAYDFINIVGHTGEIELFNNCLKNNKLCFSIHEVVKNHMDSNILNPYIRFLEKTNAPIIVHSEKSKKDILLCGKFNAQLVHKIYFGPFETYHQFKIPTASVEPYLLFIGHIHPYKGLNVLYEAMSYVKILNLGIKIVVAGNGNDDTIRKMKNDSSFIVVNRYLSNSELVSYVSNCKAVVCPYLSASQSGVIQTASVFSKPVIVTDVGAFPEMVSNYENGIIIPPNDPKSLANAIVEIFTNSDLYTQLSSNMSQYTQYHPDFNWDNIAKEYLDKIFILDEI